MRRFDFRLEQVLRWRRTQFELEEFRARQLNEELGRIGERLRGLAAARDESVRAIRETTSIDAVHLNSLATYLSHLKHSTDALRLHRAEQEKRAAEQSRRAVEARRRVRLLEKLRSRLLEIWKADLTRETENLAAESYLSQWNAEKLRSRRKAPVHGVRPASPARDAGDSGGLTPA